MGAEITYYADDSVRHVLIPDPPRLAACAVARQLPFRLINDGSDKSGKIPGELFGSTVDDGAHPVGTHNNYFFCHDAVEVGDHSGAAIVYGSRLFDLYRGRGLNLIQLAHTHDKVTEVIGEALSTLFRGQGDRFNHLIDEEATHLLHALAPGAKHRTAEDKAALRTMMSEGLDHLNLSHPNIGEVYYDSDFCGFCGK
ncbi:MAG TPA: hypothetical protein VFB59_00075 [Candidatus Saccharimonadales bacterium]|nr:hypothetical protein [Candidatus Saccharimonadales bacterium]